MNYASAVSFLDGLANYERQTGYRYDTKNFSMDRMHTLLRDLGEPQKGYPSAVIAGTKGKGSTSAMLASILTAAGHSVGLYTSPHLVEYPERIRIGLDPIPNGEFADLAEAIEPYVNRLAERGEDWRPTAFEAVTAMALLGFSRYRVAAAVLEVGMGGRLDAVNAVDAAVAVVTAISLDHTDQLGETAEAIAVEKAGIIRSAAPVVTAASHLPGAMAQIEAACRMAGAPLVRIGPEAGPVGTPTLSPAGSACDLLTTRGLLRDVWIGLAGAHQVENAVMAVEAAYRMPVSVDETAVRAGLRQVRWPGRLQVVAHRPEVLVDGAHNGRSAEVLAAAVRELWRPPRVLLVLAMLKGKHHAEVARALVPLAGRIWCPPLHHPRALSPAELAAHVAAAGGEAELVPTTGEALALARAAAGTDGLVLATGSLALAGEVMVSLSAP